MVKPIVGAGSQYMSAAKDKDGAWLDGGKELHLACPRERAGQGVLGGDRL